MYKIKIESCDKQKLIAIKQQIRGHSKKISPHRQRNIHILTFFCFENDYQWNEQKISGLGLHFEANIYNANQLKLAPVDQPPPIKKIRTNGLFLYFLFLSTYKSVYFLFLLGMQIILLFLQRFNHYQLAIQ